MAANPDGSESRMRAMRQTVIQTRESTTGRAWGFSSQSFHRIGRIDLAVRLCIRSISMACRADYQRRLPNNAIRVCLLIVRLAELEMSSMSKLSSHVLYRSVQLPFEV